MIVGAKVGEITHRKHDGGERRGYAEIARWGEERRGSRSGGLEVVQRRCKGGLHLRRGSGEADAGVAARNALHAEALLLQPVLHRCDIGAG